MEDSNRSRLVIGILLLLLGVWFLLIQIFPALGGWFNIEWSWPLIVVGVGLALLVIGLLVGNPDMIVPACVVGGIGGILYYQNATSDWISWTYLWSLIPGFVGVGLLLSALLGGRDRRDVSAGVWLIIISAVLFLIFGSIFGGLTILGIYWPVLLILLGVVILVRALWRRGA
jgi:hypothetical protein